MISTQCLNGRCYYCVGLRCEHDCHPNVAVVMDLFSVDARTTDPDTSKAAAEGTERKQRMLDDLLGAFWRCPEALSAEEAAGIAGYTAEDGAWKRVSDLKRLGLVYDTGRRVKGSSGRSVSLLAITPEGVHRVNR